MESYVSSLVIQFNFLRLSVKGLFTNFVTLRGEVRESAVHDAPYIVFSRKKGLN